MIRKCSDDQEAIGDDYLLNSDGKSSDDQEMFKLSGNLQMIRKCSDDQEMIKKQSVIPPAEQ